MIFVIILGVVSFLCVVNLIRYGKQISNITKQLEDINISNSDRFVTAQLVNSKIEKLAEAINNTIQNKRKSEAERVAMENELRKTIANMSHDLRTPLTSIIGYLQLLKLGNLSENEQKEYIRISEQRSKALQGLLNDFYELSLIESMDYELDLKKINIKSTLEQIVLEKYADFIGRNITPDINLPEKSVYIIGDGKALERIVENILGNSVKYTRDKVSISLKVNGEETILEINNTVDNMTIDDAKRAFDRFYIADKTRSGKGTGLGLSITKGLVEKMNGSITADLSVDLFTVRCTFKSFKA